MVLADEGAPKEVPVSAEIAVPFVWKSLKDSWQLDSVRPDLTNSQLRPVGDVRVSRHLVLRLDDLGLQEKGMHELQRAVALAWEEDPLLKRLVREPKVLTVFSTRYL